MGFLPTALAAVAILALGGCAGAGAGAPLPASRAARPLPGVQAGGSRLDSRALVAEAAFHFPEQTRVLVRGLLRGEFARREARRLGLTTDDPALERALESALEDVRGRLPEGTGLDDWARERYGRSAAQFTAALRQRLEENQLYQLALRADAWLHVRYRLQILASRDEEQARVWARRLQAGADPRALASASLDPGPRGDATFPPLPAYLPAPLGDALEGSGPGAVVGPFRFEGDLSWRVVRVLEVLPAHEAVPPVAELVAGLERDPVGDVEARAWFEEMVRRYTAAERLPAIQKPAQAFVTPDRP